MAVVTTQSQQTYLSPVALYDSTGNTANVASGSATTIYAVPSDGGGLYLVQLYEVITVAASSSSELPDILITWTDRDANSTNTYDLAGSSTKTLGTYIQASIIINAKISTNIQFTSGSVNAYASSAAGMTFSMRIRLSYLA